MEKKPAAKKPRVATRGARKAPTRMPSVVGDSELARLLIESIHEYAIYALDLEGRVVTWNRGAEAVKGYRTDEVVGRSFEIFFPEEGRASGEPARLLAEALRNGHLELEAWRVRKDGSRFWASVTITPLRDESGQLRGFSKVTRNLTARHEAEQRAKRELEETVVQRTAELHRERQLVERTEARLRELDRSGLVGIMLTDFDGRVSDANDTLLDLLGFTRDELDRGDLDWRRLTPPEWMGVAVNAVRELLETGRATPCEKELFRKDGSRIQIMISLTRLPEGKNLASVIDISGLKRAEAALADSRALNEQIVRSVRDGVAILDRDLRYVSWNAFVAGFTGRQSEEMVGRTFAEMSPSLVGTEIETAMRDALAGRATTISDRPYRNPETGETGWISAEYAPLLSAQGESQGVFAVVRDVTARRVLDEAVRASERRFTQLTTVIDEVFWMTDARDDRIVYVSPAYERIWGRSSESLRTNRQEWFDAIHPDERESVRASHASRRTERGAVLEYRIRRPDGSERWVRDRMFPLRNAADEIEGFAGVVEDITERRQLELQLRQSQKMEAVGQLAGGVAHDFNNLLMVVQSNCEFLLDLVGSDSEAGALLTDVRDAGARAAALTQQLLALSRRQILEPKVVDVNQTVHDVGRLLTRLLGEDISLATFLDPNASCVRVDPGYLTQVLINLAVNARDAMPRGGKLTIETSNVVLDEGYAASRIEVAPGAYLRIVVSDTGEGMPAEIRGRVFEPFFTTKGIGRGTGLGLSVVHGIVKQSGGHIDIYSEEGVGTTFKIYLPSIATVSTPSLVPETTGGPTRSGTILLVEDDAGVRRAARRMLEAEGYVVVLASDGRHALDVYDQLGSPVDLLLTDVVMPEMGGMPLAQALVARQPGLPVLFTSGYTDDAIVRHGILEPSSSFLQKPYSRGALLAKVNEMLRPGDSA